MGAAIFMSEQVLERRCAWCGRLKVNGVWVETDAPPDPLNTTHGMCPDCALRTFGPKLAEAAMSPVPEPPEGS